MKTQPAVGTVDFGELRRLRPISRSWGFDRGSPIDRFYIEQFLDGHRNDIRGRVLEIGDNRYTLAFGADRVTRSDILDIVEGRPGVTITADLGDAPQVEEDSFDCIICSQTLQFVPDVAAAIATMHRILKRGGVALVTVPTLSSLDVGKKSTAADCWRFTRAGIRRLFEARFGPEAVSALAYGNVLAATAFLHGLGAEELCREELEHVDPAYELLAAVRAKKCVGP